MNIPPITKTHTTIDPTKEAEGIEDQFMSRYRERYTDFNSDPIQGYSQLFFFITVTFRAGSVTPLRGDSRSYWQLKKPDPLSEFNLLYFQVAKQIMGKRLERKRPYQPLVHAFVDFEDSKHTTIINPRTAANPHVHALALTSPEQAEVFQRLFSDIHYPTKARIFTIDSVDIRRYDPSKGSVQNLIAYCMKGYSMAKPDEREWLRIMCPQ